MKSLVICLTALLYFSSFMSHAGVWPKATSIVTGSSGQTWTIYTSNVEVGAVTDEVVPKGYIMVFGIFFTRDGGKYFDDFPSIPFFTADGKQTIAQLLARTNIGPFHSTNFAAMKYENACAQYVIMEKRSGTQNMPASWIWRAPGACTIVPPSGGGGGGGGGGGVITKPCEFMANSIILDHGTVNAGETSRAAQLLPVKCDSDQRLYIFLHNGTDSIPLSGTTDRARIYINGEPLGKIYSFLAGMSTPIIQSEITTKSLGEHSGSATLVLESP